MIANFLRFTRDLLCSVMADTEAVVEKSGFQTDTLQVILDMVCANFQIRMQWYMLVSNTEQMIIPKNTKCDVIA